MGIGIELVEVRRNRIGGEVDGDGDLFMGVEPGLCRMVLIY